MGGGGSSRNFSASPITISQPHSVGGGNERIFFWVTGGQGQSNYLDSGNFFGHFRVTSRLPSIHCRKKTFTKSLGGAMAPLAPPLATPLALVVQHILKLMAFLLSKIKKDVILITDQLVRRCMGQYQIAVRFGLSHKTRMKCHKSHFICFHHNLKIVGSSY